jgi:hypothetical protein
MEGGGIEICLAHPVYGDVARSGGSMRDRQTNETMAREC